MRNYRNFKAVFGAVALVAGISFNLTFPTFAYTWEKMGGEWYYLNDEGVEQTGWVKDAGKWYYLDATGVMKTGWVKDAGRWYYLHGDGAMAHSSWLDLDGKWYYVYGDGSLAVNTITPDGYMVDGNGLWNGGSSVKSASNSVTEATKSVDTSESKQATVASGNISNAAPSTQNASSKKGIRMSHFGSRINGRIVDSSETAADLGVGHAQANVFVRANGAETPDGVIRNFRENHENGILNTIVLLNDNRNAPYTAKDLPGDIGFHFYGYDVNNLSAVRDVAAKTARTYASSVDNYIIGNEIDLAAPWNGMPNSTMTDVNAYTTQVAKYFRVWYEEIKKADPSANVFLPFAYHWKAFPAGQRAAFNPKDMIDILNSQLKDTDYGIAWHPYPEGLVDPNFTDDASAKNTFDTSLVTMKNINVLTDYMRQPEYLSPSGKVRHIILSEQGFNAARGEAEQAKYIKAAYEIARDNPYISAFNLAGDFDIQGEMHSGEAVYYGLMTHNQTKRQAYNVYKGLE